MKQKSRNYYSFALDSPLRESIHSFPFYIGIIVVGIWTGLLGLAFFLNSILPSPLTITTEYMNQNSFIAERAYNDLKNITSIGPKVVGSYENEVIAVEYITSRINSIMQEAHVNQQIELDIQTASGAYNLAYNFGFINSYSTIQNIVVKLHGKNNANHSVLVNSHFDSVPTSPGGSDDGINVAVLLEILRIFSTAKERPLHNIIFLFNGAEETPLMASHAFVTQHHWAKECRAVVNLDAAGAGGKIILFQTGPQNPWLIKYYSEVPHPFGQAAGEEIFQSGIIPSDTDFRIFRDFGGLIGLDMAFINDGYRYHTKFDNFSNIPLGSYQHVGDNTLSLLRNLANAPEIYGNFSSNGKTVFFDIFGWFMVSYTSFIGVLINIFTVLLSLGVFVYSMFSFNLGFSRSTLKFLGITLAAILGSWVLSGIFVYALALLLDYVNKTMSWYANPWLLYGLYVVPTIGISGCLLFFTNHEKISLSIRCQIQAHIVRLIWTIVIAVGICFNVRSVYAVMVPVLFQSLAYILIHAFNLQHSVKIWQIIYLFCYATPSIILMYQSIVTLSLFIPMTGRIGSDKNPEIIIGFMLFAFTLLVMTPLTILTNALRRARYYFMILAILFGAFLVVVFTPLGFPYSGNKTNPAPQRQWIMHTFRTFSDENGNTNTDAGFFFLNLDRNSPDILRSHVAELDRAVNVQQDCDKYIACGLPLSHSIMMEIMKYSTWIPSEQPVIPQKIEFSVISVEKVTSTSLNYSVSILGPDRLTIYIVPKKNTTLENVSLVDKLVPSGETFQDRPLYFILHQSGKQNNGLTFNFTVDVPENWIGPTVDLVVIGRYVHESNMNKTAQYLKLLRQIPDWADVTAWLGSYNSFVI